jgi:hypothetical protein
MEFSLEEECTRFMLPEELILKEEPRRSGGGLAEHHRLLKIMGDRAVETGKDSAIHLDPSRMISQVLVAEHMVHQGVLAKNDQSGPPSRSGVGSGHSGRAGVARAPANGAE